MIIPRVAVGTIQSEAEANPILWGLLAALEQAGLQVQSFRYRSDFIACPGTRAITGLGQRHLDSWLMPRELCCELFHFGSQGSDLAVVQGCYDAALPKDNMQGGSLDVLCDWLNLPRLLVVDVSRWQDCRSHDVPFAVDGILLDRVTDRYRAAALATTLETLWKAPVLAYMPEMPETMARIADIPAGMPPPREICRSLGTEFRRTFQMSQFLKIASRASATTAMPPAMWRRRRLTRQLRLALAFDDAFQCYFPDTLDLLESCGAQLRTFSPLRSPELPKDTDVVYLGCGRIERFAGALAANHCLKQSITSFVSAGGRVYAEGAGLAYLCRYLVLKDGQRFPMVNAIPAVASQNPHPDAPRPAVVRLARTTWLGDAIQELRGYLNTSWQIDPWGAMTNLALEPDCQGDLFGHRNLIGSRVHMNFAAQPQFLQAFFEPHTPTYAPV